MNTFHSMAARSAVSCLVLALLTPVARTADNAPAPALAAELASRLSAIMQDGNSYVRIRMEVKGPTQEMLQIQIKQRRTKASTEVVYQVLWPKERKGETVLLRKAGNRPVSGAVFVPPNNLRTLEDGSMKEPLFGSDLAYEDVVENFWAWEQQALVGTETVDGVSCQILESKPGKGDHSIYGKVRSWIDTRRLVPLRVEKYSTSGQALRRIDTTRVAIVDGRQTPVDLGVRRAGQSSTTTLDGSRSKHNVAYNDREFTPEGLKELTPPRDSAE
jgi:outer membrane lipoprotein-sorting protein